MKILVLGKNGQLAKHLQSVLGKDTVFLARADLDLSQITKVYSTIRNYSPDLVINAAAYTNTKNAESDPGMAYVINACAVAEMAKATNELDIPFIHISTDYVFDGENIAGYVETDEANPKNTYGASKLLGEEFALEVNPKTIIIRTSWVFSEYGDNFVKTIVQASQKKESLDVISDQIGSPTYAGHLAAVIGEVVEKLNSGVKHYGIYHYTDKEPCSWYDLAKLIVGQLGYYSDKPKVKVVNAISSENWPSVVDRPQNGVLVCKKINTDFAVKQRYWSDGLQEVIVTIKKGSH